MNKLIVEHYRCPEFCTNSVPERDFLLGVTSGVFEPYFRLLCGTAGGRPMASEETASQLLAKAETTIRGLRYERYVSERDRNLVRPPLAALYYFFRPLLPRAIRKHFQRIYFTGWDTLSMPQWPVDTTVDDLLAQLLLGVLRSRGTAKRIPFIWFWPDGAPSCAIMTHDVETPAGLRHCTALMDIDARFGIPAAYQIVPESRYHVSASFIDEVRKHGFEVNVQDLNHDGLLFRNEREFHWRAEKINAYARKFRARGFRAAALYRNHDWLKALRFEYDMSVPNVAHLDPQKGGCCTVLPYFIGDILELPVTTIQDYSLFHILNRYSLDLWKWQIELIRKKSGLISFIIHPDYLTSTPAKSVYRGLLSYLAELRTHEQLWITTPGEVNDWWRQRARLRMVTDGTRWRIIGPGSERARVAYAEERMGQLAFVLQDDELGNDESRYTHKNIDSPVTGD